MNPTDERALVECKHLAESGKCDAIRKSDIWGVKPEECHNKIKHACCYSCNLRKNCRIRCDFLEHQVARKEAENVRPINLAFSFEARSRNE